MAKAAVDPFRNQVTETPVTSMTLDAFGRAVRLVRATSQSQDARETLQTYDAGGNLISTTDAEGNIKLRSYDHAGRVIKETQAINADLGPLGINQQGLERRYAYDALGQLTDTLDVYLDGTDLMQSGQSVVYNAFGEVVDERRKWGLASQSLAALNTARVARYDYDNAGHVFDKVAADGLTVYYYNLQGQVTREEKRGNSLANQPAGSGPRITETQYDVLGRAIMIRRPAFDADITAGTGTTVRLVTPYSTRTLDRWGNLVNYQEGGYEFVNGQPVYAPSRLFRTYRIRRQQPARHGTPRNARIRVLERRIDECPDLQALVPRSAGQCGERSRRSSRAAVRSTHQLSHPPQAVQQRRSADGGNRRDRTQGRVRVQHPWRQARHAQRTRYRVLRSL